MKSFATKVKGFLLFYYCYKALDLRFFRGSWLQLSSIYIVGNKAKGDIRGEKMFVFRKIWQYYFSWNIRFEIRPFALLPTLYLIQEIQQGRYISFNETRIRWQLFINLAMLNKPEHRNFTSIVCFHVSIKCGNLWEKDQRRI